MAAVATTQVCRPRRGVRISRMKLHVLLILYGWLAIAGTGLAQTKPDHLWPTEAERRLDSIRHEVEDWQTNPPSLDQVSESYQEVLELRRLAEECSAAATSGLEAAQLKIEALGEASPQEPQDIKQRRRELEDERNRLESQQGICRLLTLGSKELQDQLQQRRQQAISREMLTRAEPAWEIGLASLRLLTGQEDGGYAAARALAFEPLHFGVVTGVSLVILIPISLALARWLRRRYPVAEDAPLRSSTLVARMYAFRLPWMTGLGALAGGLAVSGAAPLAIPPLSIIGAMAIAPLLQLLVCGTDRKCREGRPARVVLGIVMFGVAAALIGARDYLPEALWLSLRGILLALLGVVSLWLLFALSRRADFQNLRSLRLPLAVALAVGPVADWLGYRNLGQLLVLGVYGTFAGAILAWLLYQALAGALIALDDGQSHGAQRVRHFFGYKPGERIRGIVLLRWLIALGLLWLFVRSLLLSWQVSEADTAALRDFFTAGFKVGAVTIVPTRLLAAVLVLTALLTLTRWLKRQLNDRWLTGTKLDAGARQSIVTLSSYVVIAGAILLALSMAGLELSNLAIIAGALSVGIGFGLQNIVNNFVSGLILLFERPVRPGDWVVVGNTQGYVKKISIRYTQIQTFERADVLVPNSELISNQVTNWMLNDPFGRVEVPVGVAYGSDTDKVRDILLAVAKAHPLVMDNDPRVMPPRVLFISFGDSSLNFELRCFIRNVDSRLSTRSDLLFAIDKAFREAGIEIPFPQRVVHHVYQGGAGEAPPHPGPREE
jgi:small-conductance mechanosensitive channel